MEIELHERHGRMNAIVKRIVRAARPNPGKVCFLQVGFEVFQAMLEDGVRIVCVEGFEKVDDLLLLLRMEQLDWTTLFTRT